MHRKVSRRNILAGAAALVATVASPGLVLGHAGRTGVPGNPKNASRTIEILMKEGDGKMSYEPSVLRIKQGETVRFVVRNHGALEHELVIDSFEGNAKHKLEMEKNPDMEHDDPNAVRVKPQTDGTIVWRFTRRGRFEYACLIPGHYEAGMKGVIIVE